MCAFVSLHLSHLDSLLILRGSYCGIRQGWRGDGVTYHSFTFVSARFEALLRLDSLSISWYLSMRYGALVSAIDVKRTWLYHVVPYI